MNFSKIIKIIPILELDMKYGLKLISGSEITGRHSLLHLPDENAIYDFSSGPFDFSSFTQLIYLIYSPDYQIVFIDDHPTQSPELRAICVKDIKEK
jgi:hypothetical protein